MGTEGTDYDLDIEALLREQHNPTAAERELNIYRSGSAPPTVEGSRAAAAGLFSPHARAAATEEEVRSHPDYLRYYYSNENLNPRLPPPTLTREDWRAAQRLRQPIGRKEAGDGGRAGSSLFSVQPGLTARDERELMELERLQRLQRQNSSRTVDWGADGLGGMVDPRLGPRRKSFADTLKEDYGRPAPIPGHLSRPVSRNAFDNILDPTRMSDVQLTKLHNDMENVDNSYSGATSNGLARAQSFGSTKSRSFASALGTSMARSTTPDPQLIRRSPSPSILAVGGRISDADKKIISNGFANVSSGMTNSDDIANTLSVLKLSENMTEDGQNFRHVQSQQNFVDHPDLLYNMSRDQSQYMQQNKVQTQPSGSTIPLRAYNDFPQRTGTLKDVGLSSSNGQLNIPKRLPSNDVYRKLSPGSTSLARASDHLQTDRASIDFAGCDPNTFSANLGMPSLMNKQPDQVGAEGQYFNRNHVGAGYQLPITDPLYAQYLQRTSDSVPQGHGLLNDPSLGRNYSATSLMDMPGYQEAYIGALLAQQNMHYGSPFSGKSGSFNNGLYEDPNFGLGMPYPSHIPGSPFSSFGPASPLRQNDRLSCIPSIPRGAVGGSKGSWNYENRITDGGFASSLLEELKNNKTRSFELTEIVGHVLEFSGDQYGSRFIQQKLETGSVEEKNSIFPEILPHARILMTDVFGNYVIQKFFEHGTQSQRNQLADQLIGHVLPLSLQMYGCRVIQKALEVVDVNQQALMVAELDGSIMKCVRDQNGNHVIQKCIECVPQERIQFIISSFYEQVVALSTHPYGCRVIQRVLEHCDDAQTQSKMMEEILQSVCTLAQDQYGNYVVQHVLQHGKQEERSAIVSKLVGQIVKMSQQKFASNVVEKCLTYGTPEERKLLIDEILAITEENDSLQAMMKDQFGNYVVQKVLETCDDQKLELIISRIKAHLNALKKYTYGKHIVARVEKLIATGERRIGMSASSA